MRAVLLGEALIVSRLRSVEDQRTVRRMLREAFGRSGDFGSEVSIREWERLCGVAPGTLSVVPLQLRHAFCAVALCVARSFPVLLVGPPSSGKSTIVSLIARMFN